MPWEVIKTRPPHWLADEQKHEAIFYLEHPEEIRLYH